MRQAGAGVVVGGGALDHDEGASGVGVDVLPGPLTEAGFAAMMAASAASAAVVSSPVWGDLGPVEELMGPAEWDALVEVDEVLAGREGPGSVAQELADGLGSAARGLGRVVGVGPAELVGVFDAGVVEGLEAVGRLRSQVEAVGFA
ncbi:hypothetical protein, partial [Ornithinimicrobium cavernae]|uniref:hypothetical protein n=1 Tax=Ornithinimicrobium cavernae TaxID=2666047 RepID=UPI00192A3149